MKGIRPLLVSPIQQRRNVESDRGTRCAETKGRVRSCAEWIEHNVRLI